MNYVLERHELPDKIKAQLNYANLYYSEAYENYTKQRNEKNIYFWNESFVSVLRVKRVAFLQGGVFDTEPYALCTNSSLEEEQVFIDEICGLLRKIGVQWVVCAQTSSFQVFPHGAKVIPKGNLIVDLELSEEDLFKKVHSKHRNSIRRAEKNAVKIERNNDKLLDDYKQIESQTWERSKRNGMSLLYYKRIISSLSANADIVVAYKDEVPQAGGVFFYNDNMGYYLHGSTKNNPEPGAANLLIWDEMIKLKRQGVKKFNFVGYRLNVEEGSKLYGIQHFKERFGGVLYKSYNFRFVSNALAYRLYCIAMQLKSDDKKRPYRDAIDELAKEYPEYNIGIK